MTALPIVETREGEIASYIPTNLISITDGQIYFDAALFACRVSAGHRRNEIGVAHRRQGPA